MAGDDQQQAGRPRSAGTIPERRVPQPWPKDRRFRILSIDGGGILGIYPAKILAEFERFCGGRRVGEYFDLIAGTSTGGILALGLGAGLPAADLLYLYFVRGKEIFPERSRSFTGRLKRAVQSGRHWLLYAYNRAAISRLLTEALGERLFGESANRLVIPAFDGKNSEVFVYKTPHHPDYRIDRFERMVNVALATSAAPTFFQPLKRGGYTLVDGGVWANNPVMLAVIEALICFDVAPGQIDVLTLSCGEDPYLVNKYKLFGGKLAWADSIFAAMRLQSLAATNQARLLLGPPSVVRLVPPAHRPPMELDDWKRACEVLPNEALVAAARERDRVQRMFFTTPVERYVPVPIEA